MVLLTLAILLLALERFGRGPDERQRRVVVVGISSASIVLARLDLIIVAAGVGVAVLYRSRSPRRFGACSGNGLHCGAIGDPWISTFGTSITTSATAKSFIVDRWYEANFGSNDWGRRPSSWLIYVSALVRHPAGPSCDRSSVNSPPGPLSSAGRAARRGARSLRGVPCAITTMNPTWPLAPGPWAALILCTLLGIKACFDVANVGPWGNDVVRRPSPVDPAARDQLPRLLRCVTAPSLTPHPIHLPSAALAFRAYQ